MKTKPNFTYKEFIKKISHADITQKDKSQTKSPKILKTHNKNAPTFSAINCDKPFQKRSVHRESSRSNSTTPKHSPRKLQMKQNIIEPVYKNMSKPVTSIKSTTNKKLKLKNQPNLINESSKISTTKHSKSIHQNSRGNFYHNQSNFAPQRHNESCSTFFRNGNFDNEEDNFHNQSISEMKKSPSQSSKITSKKHSTSSIDGKLKIASKGNLTDRNFQRVNTQYYEEVRRPDERINTQYERNDSRRKDRLSPSFYKLSVDESSFLEYDEDKSHKNLFPQSCTSRCKKSTISLNSKQQQKVKINNKSHEHIYNKFISKISLTLFQITKIDKENKLLEHKIKYIEFLECLKELKMIRSDYEPYSQAEGVDLVKELWEELVMGQNINHFIIIVALILKITPLQHIKSENCPELQNYIYTQKKYEQFRFTRLELDKSKIYSEKQSMEYYNFPFKPTISKTSEEIASQSRSQKKYKINTSVNHKESVHQNSRRENISISNQLENPNQSSMLRSTSPLGNKRSQILYKEGKKKSLQKRQNKSTVDYEYEKNKEQLTFKPKLIIKRKKPAPDEPSTAEYISPRFAIDEQKAVNRLIRGRVQKQIKQITIDKGLPYNDKLIEKLRRQKYDEIIKEQHESRMKHCQNQTQPKLKQSNTKINTSHIHNRSKDQRSVISHKEDMNSHYRCSTQVQHLESIHNLSFQDYSNEIERVDNEQSLTNRILASPLKASNFSHKKGQQEQEQAQQEQQNSSDDFFALDIYFEQDRSDKLMIRRDSTLEEIVEEAERFVLKHNLPHEMGNKLKQELMIAMKFHDVQKIQENAEEDECSLLG